MLTHTQNTVGRTFSKSVVLESQIRDRLAIYQQARQADGTEQDSHPAPDKVQFASSGHQTEILLAKDRLFARTKDQDGQVVSLEKIEATLLTASKSSGKAVAQEASELPNGDGYWMEGEWSIKTLPQPSKLMDSLNREFEREWTFSTR